MILLLVACLPPAELGGAFAKPPDPLHAPPPPPVEATPPPPPGSLWSEVGSRTLIGMDGNARRVGDLITVLVSETASTTLDASTDASREGGTEVGISALFGVETAVTKANSNMNGQIALGGSSSTTHSGTGSTTRNGSLTATITCQVEAVLPNGNLRIRGSKEVRVNRETQYLTLEGVVRPRDIHLDNTVRSDVIADARVEFTGAGVVASKQNQGWGAAVMDAVWPF